MSHTIQRFRERLSYTLTDYEYGLLCQACENGYQILEGGKRYPTQEEKHLAFSNLKSWGARELHRVKLLYSDQKAYVIYDRSGGRIVTAFNPKSKRFQNRVKKMHKLLKQINKGID